MKKSRNRKSKSRSNQLNFTPIGNSGTNYPQVPLLQDSGARPKSIDFSDPKINEALKFFATNPSIDQIADFAKGNTELFKDDTFKVALAASSPNISNVLTGVNKAIKGFSTDSVFREAAIERGANTSSQLPNADAKGFSPVGPKSNRNLGVYKNIYSPPNGSNGNKISLGAASNGNAPSVNGSSFPIVQPTEPLPNNPVNFNTQGGSSGLPSTIQNSTQYTPVIPPSARPPIFPVGGQQLNTTYQPIGGITTGALPTGNIGGASITPTSPAQATLPKIGDTDNIDNIGNSGYNLSRESVFGSKDNLGWLTGGAQLASGVFDIYNGYKQTKLAREQYDFKKASFSLDYQAKAKAFNESLYTAELNKQSARNGFKGQDKTIFADTFKKGEANFERNKLDPNAASKL